jgi:type IX secretion system PorP/SprF family membrane protein
MAQQLPELSLRAFDQTAFNPAANGTKDYSQVMLHHRSQWVGFSNAPNTQFLTYNGKLKENMGIGGLIMNDITGPTRRFSASVAYDYHVKFDNFKLSLGLAAGIMQYGIDGKKITIYQNTDMAVAEQVSMKSTRPNVDFGAWLYNDKFFAGVSIMQLLSNKIKMQSNDLNAVVDLANHFYITSGYTLDMNEDITLQPSFLVGGTFGTPLLIDLGVKAEMNDKFTAGLGFRTNDALVLMAGIKIKQHFTIAYSYDIVVSKLRKYNSGSHDLVLRFDITSKKKEAKVL